ncbi:hypothetical protein [Clostridium saudiense]|uniref:hypothetical protein n=1 Tax=Clostridium saudiense TaxID=1414720 RepID=UPI0018AA6739|nr:hypothetical protein [Clostridium saudiense]
MANIQNYLNQIKTAVFGKDVRESIHDAIKQCYDDATVNHDNANMEVKLARGSHNTLNDRLDENEKKQENLSSQLNTKVNKNEIYLSDYNNSDIDDIKSALELSELNGKNVIFDTRTYNVEENIILNGVNCDFRNGTINLSGNSLILENNSSLINCNVVNGGVILRNGKNRIDNITIRNFTTALKLDVGNYESFINNIRLENEENSSNTVGILVNCSDTTVSKVYGYGANTGIKIVSGGDNYFKDVHLWLKKTNYYDGSKFIHIANGIGNHFINCCSDTYNNVFHFDLDYLYTKVTDMYIIHNTVLYPNKTINLINKNYNFLNGNCSINSNDFTTSNITLNIKDSALNISYLNGNGSNTVFNVDKIKEYITFANVDSKSIIKEDGKNLICNLSLFYSSQYDLTTPITIELPIFKHSYKFFGYCLGVGTSNAIAMAQYTLENGILTISKLGGTAPQLWSLNINFIATKDLSIN